MKFTSDGTARELTVSGTVDRRGTLRSPGIAPLSMGAGKGTTFKGHDRPAGSKEPSGGGRLLQHLGVPTPTPRVENSLASSSNFCHGASRNDTHGGRGREALDPSAGRRAANAHPGRVHQAAIVVEGPVTARLVTSGR